MEMPPVREEGTNDFIEPADESQESEGDNEEGAALEQLPEGETQEINGEGESDYEGEQSDTDHDQIPLLFVDVNLGEGLSDRIVLYDGDQPSTLAQEFATRHSLDDGMKMKLTDLLTQ